MNLELKSEETQMVYMVFKTMRWYITMGFYIQLRNIYQWNFVQHILNAKEFLY